jgi:hypothetical protein
MDFVAIKTKTSPNIEIVGSKLMYFNPQAITSNYPDEIILIDELCSSEASEHSGGEPIV